MKKEIIHQPVASRTSWSDTPYGAWSTPALLNQLFDHRSERSEEPRSLPELFNQANDDDPCVRQCLVAREVVRRWLLSELERGALFTSPQMVQEFLQNHFAGYEQEAFIVLFLDAQHRLIRAEEMFRGTLTQTSVYPREIVKAALKHNCAAVIFAHNHPSGSTAPSRADETLTQVLKAALDLVDVRVVDHLVVGHGATLSFAEQRLL